MSPTGDLLVTQFFSGKCPLELAQGPSCVALAWHKARGSTPFGVTNFTFAFTLQACSQLDEWCSYVPFCFILPLCSGPGLISSFASACLPAASLPLLCFLLQKLFFCTLAPGECFFRVAFFCKASFCFDFLASPKVLHPAVYHSVHFITHQSFAFY